MRPRWDFLFFYACLALLLLDQNNMKSALAFPYFGICRCMVPKESSILLEISLFAALDFLRSFTTNILNCNENKLKGIFIIALIEESYLYIFSFRICYKGLGKVHSRHSNYVLRSKKDINS